MAPPSGNARPSSAAAVASAQRAAATGSPESRASHARARHSRGSPVTTSGASASSQRRTVAPRPLCSDAFHDVATRSAASASRPAREQVADRARHVARPAHHAPARACSSAMPSGAHGVLELAAAGRRGRRGGSETTRGARRAARGRGWRARSRSSIAWTRPRRARRRTAARRSGPARRSRGGSRERAGPGPRRPRRRGSRPDGGRRRGPPRRASRADRAAIGRRGRARAAQPSVSRAQLRELILREGERERVVQQRRGLGVAEAQLLAGDLVELGPCAQARDADRRLGPRGDDQVRGAREVLEQEAHALVDRRVGDQVVVVEHENVPGARPWPER